MMLRRDDVGRAFLYAVVSQPATEPPSPDGVRVTTTLSSRAIRQIKGAAIKAEQRGYRLRTFITFTVRAEERDAFQAGVLVLGQEMKRVINALKQWLRRDGRGQFVYIWVAENVRNENPHVHMLTDFAVPRREFDAFAARVESLWGHGYAHVERVRRPKEAGRYIIKAIRYTLKAADEDQGRLIGNRYGISRNILPKYEVTPLYDCLEAMRSLRDLQASMTGEIEELAEGLWLTPFGLAFGAGTEAEKIGQVLEDLGEAVHMSA